MAIRSFRCADTESLYQGAVPAVPKRFRNIETVAQRKLQMLDDAVELRDLASPPGNRLEALRGDRTGQHSVRINDQWRVCFVWTPAGPARVEIVDYH
ncbi:MAG: type II toxin-antitoxin system RelE/ParE family toxin [Burkholderiaceae bacterium]|nr:type II toxin-antitoxin system RelE/ParE family toxin [Burkholderiaceae bacterium]